MNNIEIAKEILNEALNRIKETLKQLELDIEEVENYESEQISKTIKD